MDLPEVVLPLQARATHNIFPSMGRPFRHEIRCFFDACKDRASLTNLHLPDDHCIHMP